MSKKKPKLYTVPFSEPVPSQDGKHRFLGLLIRAKYNENVARRARHRLGQYLEEDGLFYNPPIVTEVLDESEKKARELKEEDIPEGLLDEIVNKSQVHITTPSEILHSNFSDNSVDHLDRNCNAVDFHAYHYDFPEDWFIREEHEKIMERKNG